MGKLEKIPISSIETDGRIQLRESMDFVTIAEYSEAMRTGASFPPVEIFFDGESYWLSDGNHRLNAARQIGEKSIDACVRAGTKRDAILAAAGSNDSHGLRRKPEDKRRAVNIFLADDEWCSWSDRQIGRQCKVSHTFVAKLRAKVTGNVASELPIHRRYITKNGTPATMNTANIGNGEVQPVQMPIISANKAIKSPRLIVGRADEMHQIEDDSIDLIITSPPYNLGHFSGKKWTAKCIDYDGHNDSLPETDYQTWQLQCLNEMYRVARPGASLFYNHKVRTENACIIHPLEWLPRSPWDIRQEIIWDRGSTHLLNANMFYPIDERIYWMVKGKPTLPDRAIRLNTIWRFNPDYGNAHPAPFPIELPTHCLQAVGRQNMIVLDPFAGSCTTLKAAISFGCDAIGMDISMQYLELAKEANGWQMEIEKPDHQ